MADSRVYVPNLHATKSDGAHGECVNLEVNSLSSPPRPDGPKQYEAISPKGIHISIPRELFVALSDFMMTRKCPGSITIQFRNGEILCVESLAKKTFRTNS